MKTLELTYKGRDDWDRPVYECDEKLYVDVEPNSDYPHICTKSNNEFDGEPDYPIKGDIKFSFVPSRDRW